MVLTLHLICTTERSSLFVMVAFNDHEFIIYIWQVYPSCSPDVVSVSVRGGLREWCHRRTRIATLYSHPYCVLVQFAVKFKKDILFLHHILAYGT